MRRFVAVLLALLMVTATVATPVAAAAGTSSGKLAPSITTDEGFWGTWNPSEAVKRYGAEQYPGWIVQYEQDHADDLRSWANGSTERTILEHDPDSRFMLISAPKGDVLVDSGFLPDLGTLRELDAVERIGVNRKTGVDPLTQRELANKSAWEKPDGLGLATFVGGGSLEADGAAWKSEVNTSGLQEVRASVSDDEVSVDGNNSRIAVLDSGMDYSEDIHGDRVPMAYNALTNESVTIANTSNVTASDYDLVADGTSSNHGSWVVTMAAGNGSTANATGIAKNATIIPVKVLDDSGSGSTENIADGLEWACGEANADIISMSLGSPVPSERINAEITECLNEEDVSAVVVAAGNSRLTYRYLASPGDQQPVVSVTATDAKALNNSESAYFSNVGPDPQTGKNPTVGAPGMSITATVADGNVTLSGTSMAAPVVTGLLAETIQARPSLEGKPAELRTYLQAHAEPLPNAGVTEVGAGRPDAANLVNDVEPSTDQEGARNEPAKNRDRANRALSTGFWGSLLG